MFLTLFTKRSSDYVVVMHIERLVAAPRSPARTEPPTDQHFRQLPSDPEVQELIATTSAARYTAKAASKCEVHTGEVYSYNYDPFSCTSTLAF